MGNIDIRNTENYNTVSATGVSAEQFKKEKMLRIFGMFDLNHDGQLNSLELSKAMDYFSALDKGENPDGIIEDDEFKQGAEILNQELALDKKNALKAGDIKKFIDNLMKLTAGDTKIDIAQLFFFINDENNDKDSDLDIQNLTNAEFNDEEDGGGYTLTYKDGTIVKVKPDKSYEITKKDAEGRTVVTSYNSNKENLQEVITDLSNNVTTIKYQTVTNEDTQETSTVMSEKEVVYQNGDKETTQYQTLGGETMPTKMTQVTTQNGIQTKAVINYTLGEKFSEIVTTGNTESIYNLVGNSTELVRKRENISSENERTTNYTYNDNGTVTVSIVEQGRRTVQTRTITPNNTARNVIEDDRTITYESIEEDTPDGVIITEVVYLEEGRGNARIEKVTDTSGKITTTIFNENNHRENSIVEINGQKYAAEYDGEGHTYLVFTIDDPARISRMARSFGTTPEAIYRANQGLYHVDATTGAKYFIAGTKIKIPTEIEANNRYLQARGSQGYERDRGNQLWGEITEAVNNESASRSTSLVRLDKTGGFSNFRDFAIELFRREGNTNPNRYLVDARVLELKELNPTLTDGNLQGKTLRFKYTAAKENEVHNNNIVTQRQQYNRKLAQENRAATPVASQIYNYIEDNIYALQSSGHGWEAVQSINSQNIISVLEIYKTLNGQKSIFSHIDSEGDTTIGDRNNKNAMFYITNALAERCRAAGMDQANIAQFHSLTHQYIENLDIEKLNNLVDKMCNSCRLLEGALPEEINARAQRGQNAVGSTVAGLGIHADQAENTLNYFNQNEENFCGVLWEGLKCAFTLGNAHNLDENVKADINSFRGYISQLESAYKNGGETPAKKEAAFRAKFREIFGTNFDPQIANAYAVKLENFQKAVATQNVLSSVDNFRGAWDFDNFSYDNAVACTKLIFSQLNPDANIDDFIEQSLRSKLGDNYSTATVQQKRAALISSLKEFTNTMQRDLNVLTDGKSLAELQRDLSKDSGTLFGTKHDMMDRVHNYISAQKKGSAYTSTALKIGAMAAFGLAGGGFALSFSGTFISSAGIDLINTNDYSSENLWDITKNAALDGLFSGVGTYVRDGLKAGKFVLGSHSVDITKYVNITKGSNASFLKTQGTLIGADSTVSTINQASRGGFSAEGLGITILWSTIAHVGSVKLVNETGLNGDSKSNLERCFRRTGKGGGKEQKVAGKDFSSNLSVAANITPARMKEQLQTYISDITNLGDLNAMNRFITHEIPVECGRNDLLAMITEQQQRLFSAPQLISFNPVPISPEIRNDALNALSQSAEHLLPNQLNDIMDYIDTISDPNEFLQAINQLQRHGIDFNEESELRFVLDDKFAELQLVPPYRVEESSVLYALINQQPGTATPNPQLTITEPNATPIINIDITQNIIQTPTLDSYTPPVNTNPVAELPPVIFNQLKSEITTVANNSYTLVDIDGLKNRLNFLENPAQKNILLGIIDTRAAQLELAS